MSSTTEGSWTLGRIINMELIESLNNCLGIKKVGNQIYAKFEDSVSSTNNFNLTHEQYDSLIEHQEKAYFTFNDSLFSAEGGQVFSLKGFDQFYVGNNFFFGHKRVSRKELHYSLIDKELNIIWGTTDNCFMRLYGEHIIQFERLDRSKFLVKNLNNQHLWRFDALEGHNIQDIYLIQNTLYLTTRDKNFRLIKKFGIDINSGNISWEQTFEVPFKNNIIASTFNKKDNLFYGLSQSRFQIFNPVQGKLIKNNEMPDDTDSSLEPEVVRQSIDESHLFFVSGVGIKSKFGSFNIKSESFDFVTDHKLKEDDKFDTPLFHDGILYLRTLHSNKLLKYENLPNILYDFIA